MGLSTFKYFLLVFFLFPITVSVKAQKSDNIWSKTTVQEKSNSKKKLRRTFPNKFEVFDLKYDFLKEKLKRVKNRQKKKENRGTIISFPNKRGELELFEVYEASIMSKELQNKFPAIKSYVGKGIDNPGSSIRFSVTSLGLHAMIFQSKGGTVFIDPYTSNKESYLIYSKISLPAVEQFQCEIEELSQIQSVISESTSSRSSNANDGNLRTFRLAIATTGEYSQYHLINQGINGSASEAEKKAAVLSAINVTMTRVNGIFERDVALTMELVGNNADIIFLDKDTDGFTNDDSSKLLNESQTVIDSAIGELNYDIGHTFSTGGGGLAVLKSPCTTSKAKGITGSNNPIGDSYNIDFVAHEMGHQFGAHHSFNGNTGGCDENRNDATAIEPGSGSTIMSYAGLCSPYNVQSLADAYFHLVSIREIWNNINTGYGTCATSTDTGNNAPTIDPIPNYTIPVSTPFALRVSAQDIDNDFLTFTWEQLDNEIASMPLVSTSTIGPAFRSIEPSTDSTRYFPKLNTVISGNLANTWEVLPSVSRTMQFGVNVRDNNTNGGQTASRETTITFDENFGPFRVTSQSESTSWDDGTVELITWDIANTNMSPVNCDFVNILLSIDGGYTFPITLAENVANDGSQSIVVPSNTTNTARVKVESVGNVFYAINSVDITIQSSEFVMNFDTYSQSVCAPNIAVYTITYNTFLGFNEETTFSATGNPSGTTVAFSPVSVTNNNSVVVMTISGISDAALGNHNIVVSGTSVSVSKDTEISLKIYTDTVNEPVLSSPENNATELISPYELSWDEDVNAVDYQVQVATDINFTTIVEDVTVKINSFITGSLLQNTSYYWRVKSLNNCAESNYSEVSNFKTANVVCGLISATDIPQTITDNDSNGVVSEIYIYDNKLVTDVNVKVNITHNYVSDLTLSLKSPNGTTILMASANGDDGRNFTNTVFDDEASSSINVGVAPFDGKFKPLTPLSNLNGGESLGVWTLKAIDTEEIDEGILNGWDIEICGVAVISDDDDKDGVVNDDDFCPNTPLNEPVDLTGCPIFNLPPDNFTIEVTSEACPNKNNGEILITAVQTHNYIATINSINYDFNNNIEVNDLSPGEYDVCIAVIGENFEQCFTIKIKAGVAILGKGIVQNKNVLIDIIQGTSPYEVFINGNLSLQTSASTFNIEANHGDLIEVKTAIDCEGVFSKSVVLYEKSKVYPNPTTGEFEIILPVSYQQAGLNGSKIGIELYNLNAKLISKKVYSINAGKVNMNIQNLASGIYFVKVLVAKPLTLKILKH